MCMRKFTDVTFKWEDGKTTIESFFDEEDVIAYMDSIFQDTNIKCEEFSSENPEWNF